MLVTAILGVRNFISYFEEYGREWQFSEEGFKRLYDYLEDLSSSLGEDLVIDVIGLCCDYSECTIEQFREEFDAEPEDCEFVISTHKDDEGNQVVLFTC